MRGMQHWRSWTSGVNALALVQSVASVAKCKPCMSPIKQRQKSHKWNSCTFKLGQNTSFPPFRELCLSLFRQNKKKIIIFLFVTFAFNGILKRNLFNIKQWQGSASGRNSCLTKLCVCRQLVAVLHMFVSATRMCTSCMRDGQGKTYSREAGVCLSQRFRMPNEIKVSWNITRWKFSNLSLSAVYNIQMYGVPNLFKLTANMLSFHLEDFFSRKRNCRLKMPWKIAFDFQFVFMTLSCRMITTSELLQVVIRGWEWKSRSEKQFIPLIFSLLISGNRFITI